MFHELWPYSVTVFQIFFLQIWWIQVNFGLKNWVGGFCAVFFVVLEKSFDLVYYSPSNDFGNKSYGRLYNSLIFFLRNWWKHVNFGRKNSVGGVRPTTFVELEQSIDLVYNRPSNDFWIKSYSRIQSQFFDFFPPNRMKTSEFCPKKLGWRISRHLIGRAQK